MIKKFLLGMFSIFSALLQISLLTIPAAADNDATKVQPSDKQALVIKAPNTGTVSQQLTVTIFNKRGQELVAGASVYALKTDDLVVNSENTDYATLLNEYLTTAQSQGYMLGITGTNGTLSISISVTGRYILVANKDGYSPGFARLSIVAVSRKELNIRMPGAAEVNKAVTILVTERYTQDPIANIAIYAVPLADNSSQPLSLQLQLKPVMPQLQAQMKGKTSQQPEGANGNKDDNNKPFLSAQVQRLFWTTENTTIIKPYYQDIISIQNYAAAMQQTGVLLGYTDIEGKLIYTFSSPGVFVVLATKDDYLPAFDRISVKNVNQGKIVIKAPDSAEKRSSVVFLITDRSSGQAENNTALWALRIDDIKGTAEPVWESLIKGSAQDDVTEKYRGWVKDRGILLGNSNDFGEVAYTFNDAGRYLLTAQKDGHAPAFSQIRISSNGNQQLDVRGSRSTVVEH